MYCKLALIAFIIDKIFGEFSFIKHPVIIMGNYIQWFEQKCYADRVLNGTALTLSLIGFSFLSVYIVEYFVSNIYILAIIASMGIASKMLYDSVEDILLNPFNIKYLVSRDTQNLSQSDINKASIETYAENLSDGVIAPLFYLILFGLYGLFIYKAINTLDSMVGYKNKKYKNFGYFSAKLDDVVNFIPARITAVLIAILLLSKKALLDFYTYGVQHDSPNAGHPIASMALALNISLGGNTSYFGKIKHKAYFGNGEKNISKLHIRNALSLQIKLDIFIILFLSFCL